MIKTINRSNTLMLMIFTNVRQNICNTRNKPLHLGDVGTNI